MGDAEQLDERTRAAADVVAHQLRTHFTKPSSSYMLTNNMRELRETLFQASM